MQEARRERGRTDTFWRRSRAPQVWGDLYVAMPGLPPIPPFWPLQVAYCLPTVTLRPSFGASPGREMATAEEAFRSQGPRYLVAKSRFDRVVALLVVGIPFVGVFLTALSVVRFGISGFELLLLLCFYVLTMVGITVGFHRHFAHKSFMTRGTVRIVLGVLGSFAWQGPILRWAADHRRHHAFSDSPNDPHSPNTTRVGLSGLAYAHLGWIFDRERTRISVYARDLVRDPLVRRIDRLYPVWSILSVLIPSLIGLLFLGGVQGFFRGALWGGLLRIFATQHSTWCVNSLCHYFGSRPFSTTDESRNNALVAILTFGEGWHNNHHRSPSSAKHGLSWFQLDLAWLIISGLRAVGLADNVKTFECTPKPMPKSFPLRSSVR